MTPTQQSNELLSYVLEQAEAGRLDPQKDNYLVKLPDDWIEKADHLVKESEHAIAGK